MSRRLTQDLAPLPAPVRSALLAWLSAGDRAGAGERVLVRARGLRWSVVSRDWWRAPAQGEPVDPLDRAEIERVLRAVGVLL